MENVEDMECESDQLDCQGKADKPGELLLPVLALRKILENLSNADLLNLSLVNKEWNYEARIVLRDRGSLTAKMNTDDGKCKDLRAFASDVRRMKELRKVVPLTGLTIAIGTAHGQHGDWCEESSAGELDSVSEDILHYIQWKHLALRWRHRPGRKETCTGFNLMKKVLNNFSGILEEFSLTVQGDNESFIRRFLQDYNFSHVTTMKFQTEMVPIEGLIKTVVSHAPNLKVLSTGYVELKANLLEGRPAAVHLTDFPYRLPDCEIPASIIDQLRLRRLDIRSINEDMNAQVERFTRMVPKLLEKSRSTLSSVQVDARFLPPLMIYGIYLKNVQKLTLDLSYSDVSQPYSSGFLESFDFNRLFQNLSSVEIHLCRSCPNHEPVWNSFIGMVDQGNATLTEPHKRSLNVKELTLIRHPDRDAPERFLVKMFPHIKQFVINAPNIPFDRYWDYWLDLEELDFRLMTPPNFVENLDSAFCGIFPEEVAELRERDDEYLQSVNIVPVIPSLSCLKRLKTFRLWFASYAPGVVVKLSKVAGWIAFKRRPDLTVTLATDGDRFKRAMQHMEPYATVQLISLTELEEREEDPDGL